MLSRRHWIAEFIGHVLRRVLSDDPDWAFEVASESYPEWGDVDRDFAADSAFSPEFFRREPLAGTEFSGVTMTLIAEVLTLRVCC